MSFWARLRRLPAAVRRHVRLEMFRLEERTSPTNVAVESIRLLRTDLALLDGVLEYSGGIGAGGVSQGRSSQPFAAVIVNRDDSWLILSLTTSPVMNNTRLADATSVERRCS